MPRFRSSRTGSVVVTDAETATRMGPEWEAADEPKKSTTKKSSSPKK